VMANLWKPLQRTLLAVALLLMLFHLFIYVVYAISLLRFPFDYDQGEGFELLDSVYLSEGHWPYQNSDEWPFYSSNYAPIFRLILTPFVWIFGPDYWYGRLLSFLGTFVTAFAIGYAVYKEGRRTALAALIGLAFLASNYIYHIGPLYRQHYFMVMFETLAMVALAPVFDLPQNQQRKRLLIGLALLLAAGYTKQLAAYTVVAFFAWFFLRSPRRAVIYGIGFGAIAGAIFLFLNVATDGQWKINAIDANINQYIFSQFTGLLKQFIRLHWVLLVLAGLMTIYELYFARISLYSVWWVVGLASTFGSGKWGAGDSYFATALAGTCILAGIFVTRTLNGDWTFPENYITRTLAPLGRFLRREAIMPPLGTLCLGLMIVYGLTVVKIPTSGAIFEPLSKALGVAPQPGHRYPLYDAANWTPGYATIGHLPSEADTEAGWLIVERIQAVEGPVMSEEAGFSLQAGKEVIGNPTQLKNLADAGLLDPSKLIAAIEDQEFGLIIFRARFYPELVLAAVDNAYAPREVIVMNGFNYELWYPESTWPTRREIRNFLEGTPSTPLTMTVPEEIEDVEQWMLDMMARWAWLPELELEPSITECLEKTFIRRGKQTTLSVCDNQLSVSPPKAANVSNE
jgi:hypothetical protein